MGECAYTVEWCECGYLRPFSMFDTCVGIGNDGSIDTCSDGRICHLSFDWQTKALIIGICHDCCSFYDAISGGTPPVTCCHIAIYPHALPIHLPECNHPRLKPGCLIVPVYCSDKVQVGTLCHFMYHVREIAEASNADIRQLGGSHVLYLAVVVMYMT